MYSFISFIFDLKVPIPILNNIIPTEGYVFYWLYASKHLEHYTIVALAVIIFDFVLLFNSTKFHQFYAIKIKLKVAGALEASINAFIKK